MKVVTLRELKINPSKVLKELRRGYAIVTVRGKPAAALIPLDEETLEEFILTHHPGLQKQLTASYREYKRKGGKNLAAMRKKMRQRRG